MRIGQMFKKGRAMQGQVSIGQSAKDGSKQAGKARAANTSDLFQATHAHHQARQAGSDLDENWIQEVTHTLAFDIGSNSVGSVWIDSGTGDITAGTSIFPAGVDETEDERGDPKNVKRRGARRTRITLRRRAQRKRKLRLKLIEVGLLPATAEEFRKLLETTDPWKLRREGLDKALTPYEFGRVLLHLAQRRGALGLRVAEPTRDTETDGATTKVDSVAKKAASKSEGEDGAVKAAIGEVRVKMLAAKARTFGEYIAMVSDQRRHALPPLHASSKRKLKGPREYRGPIRNQEGGQFEYQHCADRAMIRDEFHKLWNKQLGFGSETSKLLTNQLCGVLDDPNRENLDGRRNVDATARSMYRSTFREGGLLFEQRRATWDVSTLGRCTLEPTDRCVPHADMYASRYRVVETLNNLRLSENYGATFRPLTPEERSKLKDYLSGPLDAAPAPSKAKPAGKRRAKANGEDDELLLVGEAASSLSNKSSKLKTTVSATDIRLLLGWSRSKKDSPNVLNIEKDEDREINTDWFMREIVHRGMGLAAWQSLSDAIRNSINSVLLKRDPAEKEDGTKLISDLTSWAGLTAEQAQRVHDAWLRRPNTDAKRLTMSRRAVRNLLTVMDRNEPWPETNTKRRAESPYRWLTEIEARKILAEDAEFRDVTSGNPLSDEARRRYLTGRKGATAADRHYMRKHLLMKDGKPIIGPDGKPLSAPPPAPMISNPVVRKAIHEVRRHLVEYMTHYGRRPDRVVIELARQAKMGKKDADRALYTNRLRAQIKDRIKDDFDLHSLSATQQETAVLRTVLCAQQGGICPLCGNREQAALLTLAMAARGEECELSHIVPRGIGGHNGKGNMVLGHKKCNRDMARRTPREYWQSLFAGGDAFAEGMRRVTSIYGDIKRSRSAKEGDAFYKLYFDNRDDKRKIEQFAKGAEAVQDMSQAQLAATTYATRQVMSYIADALYGGHGLPERATGTGAETDTRRIFTTDGLWTSRLRREWGLFFDPHDARSKELSTNEKHARREKNRGDHRHHAIDAVVIALCTPQVQRAWDQREKAAIDEVGPDGRPRWNTADEEQMEQYRALHPLPIPRPFTSREQLRNAVEQAVFGTNQNPRPICHRPTKRKIVNELHEANPQGAVLDANDQITKFFTKSKSVTELHCGHLRMPDGWDELELTLHNPATSVDRKQVIRKALASMEDPTPAKSGIVRDRSLRHQLRLCVRQAGLDPDFVTAKQIEKLANDGRIRLASGVPIRRVVLLTVMNRPVLIPRRQPSYDKNRLVQDDRNRSVRAYVGGNNHHIEVRAKGSPKKANKSNAGQAATQLVLAGTLVTTYDAALRKRAKLRAFQAARIPKPEALRKLQQQSSKLYEEERRRLRPLISDIERKYPIVDRGDNDALGGSFVMSICEGETLYMRHKGTNDVGYFVVAKIDSHRQFCVFPHWDARSDTQRKGLDDRAIECSERELLTISVSDLLTLAPPGHAHARKVRVSVLGKVTYLERD